MTRRILFVDDEPNVLAGFERLFRKDYQLDTAPGGGQALVKIVESGPYAVVLSDMRMPRMSGAEFLSRVRDIAPDTVRMVLTGETDIGTAMRAVNEGAIFRFLLKPCAEPTLRAALDAGLRQYELMQNERFLLEKTLGGSIKVLTEVLSIVNPAAFGRSVRIQRYVRHIIEKLHLHQESWQYEVAAMLSQIGCVTLPPKTLEAINAGESLPEIERQRYLMHASVGHDLLAHVPRLEKVATMICRQHEPANRGTDTEAVTLGAQILKVCLGFDQGIARGQTVESALQAMRNQPEEYNLRLVAALTDIRFDAMSYHPRVMDIAQLEAGMIVDQDVRTKAGSLLVAKGQELTFPMVVRLQNFSQNGAIAENLRVLVLRPDMQGLPDEPAARAS